MIPAMHTPVAQAGPEWAGPYAGARVTVLGATGFIGRRLVRALGEVGACVTAVGRDAQMLAALGSAAGVDHAECDLAHPADVALLLERLSPDIAFNVAGYGVDRGERVEAAAYRINGELPAVVAAVLARQQHTRWRGQALVHVGSALEYGVARGNLREDTTPAPTTLYGMSKLQGTRAVASACRTSGLRGVTARLFTVYGPGEHPGRLLPELLRVRRTGAALDLTAGEQRRDFTYVDDVVEALLRLGLAAALPGEVVNVGTGTLETVRRFAERAAAVLRVDAGLLRFGALPVRSEEMCHDPVAVDRLRALTGYTPRTSIEDGVLLTLCETDSPDGQC